MEQHSPALSPHGMGVEEIIREDITLKKQSRDNAKGQMVWRADIRKLQLLLTSVAKSH